MRLRRGLAAVRDLVDDVVVGIGRSPTRAVLLGLGAAVACGVLAFSIATSSTEASRVASRFDELAASRLSVDLPLPAGTYTTLDEAQLRSILGDPGVVSVAWVYRSDARVTSARETQWAVDEAARLYLIGGDSQVLSVGRGPGEAALPGDGLWVGAATDLSRSVPRFALVEVDGTPVPVAGAIRRSDVLPEMLAGVVMPTSERTVDLTRQGKLIVQVRLGWADVVARRLRARLEPVAPAQVVVSYPPEAAQLRQEIVTRVDSLVLIVSLALLLVSAVTVGLATFARVLERRRLIGLLRAVGAARVTIVAGLAMEAAIVGGVAGMAGAVVGLAAAVARAGRDGPVVVPWAVLAVALAVAFLVNGLGALVPSWAATRISPIRAIRDL